MTASSTIIVVKTLNLLSPHVGVRTCPFSVVDFLTRLNDYSKVRAKRNEVCRVEYCHLLQGGSLAAARWQCEWEDPVTVSLSTASEPPAGPPVGPGKRGRCGRSTALAFLRATACYSVGMPSPPSFLSPLSLSSFFSPHYTRVYIRLFSKFSLLFFIIPFFSYSFTHVSLLSLVCSLSLSVSWYQW